MTGGESTPEGITEMFDVHGSFDKFRAGAAEALEGMDMPMGKTSREEFISADLLKRFLNRLLGVRLELQDQMFLFFSQLMELFISEDKKAGKYSEGISDVAGKNKQVARRELLYECPRTGAITEHVEVRTDRGVSWEEAERMLEEHEAYSEEHEILDDRSGFYKDEGTNADYRYFLALRKSQPLGDKRSPYYILVRPNIGNSRVDYPKRELRHKTPVRSSQAIKRWWDELYHFYESKCTHLRQRKYCSNGELGRCGYGTRMRRIHIITGLCLPFWKDIAASLETKTGCRVVRIQVGR
jgi:hypothetical protein